MANRIDTNPFKPGAGHSPPYLAGREKEAEEFRKLLHQDVVSQNVVLTGLRGVGKTVLMDDVYKPLALKEQWVWVGSDFSESAFVDERTLCMRLLTDLSSFTGTLTLNKELRTPGFRDKKEKSETMGFGYLMNRFDGEAGLNVDKLKAALSLIWDVAKITGKRGIVFAYDEAQVVQDRKDKDEFPLALLLETFQSLQRKGMRYMLLLTGLPTLFPRLVESRTYAERMFTIHEIGRLDRPSCKEAIEKPLANNAIQFAKNFVAMIIEVSSCYPYFIQFFCREAYDILSSHQKKDNPSIPMDTLIRKLDAAFFAGRWGKLPDRQRELLFCIASLSNAAQEFTVNQIVGKSREIENEHEFKSFKAADVSAILPKLVNAGLTYRNRHGRYVLAVPLFDGFIKRQFENKDAGATFMPPRNDSPKR
jgi:hypothetical protein